MKAKGGLGTGLAIFVVIVVLAFAACLAVADDDEDSMAPTGHHRDRERHECRRHCSDSGDGDREGNNYCVMPCDFVIVIPPGALPGGMGDGEQASLVPPNPEKLVGAITGMTKAVGDAAGALAGAIAGGTIGILL